MRMIVMDRSGTPPMTWRPAGRQCWDVTLTVQRRKRRISGASELRLMIQTEIAVTPSSGAGVTPGRSVMRLR